MRYFKLASSCRLNHDVLTWTILGEEILRIRVLVELRDVEHDVLMLVTTSHIRFFFIFDHLDEKWALLAIHWYLQEC